MKARIVFLCIVLLTTVSPFALGRELSATVDKSGELVSGVGVHRVIYHSTGSYEVTFERSIEDCRVSEIVVQDQTRSADSLHDANFIPNGSHGLLVETSTSAGAPSDSSFRLSVNCPEPSPPPAPLVGYVDLHTHPLANVGFGGKLLYGGVDVGALLPADPDCMTSVRATSMQQALGHDGSTHGFWNPFTNACGDSVRAGVIFALQKLNNAANESPDARGAPDFNEWPVWNDLTHQKMWVEWLRRAFDSGLHVMVALSVNNKTLADATAGPCDYPTDDKSSTDLQLAEIKAFVSRHPEFMEVALTAGDLARIVRSKKLAIVLGAEVDFIGNLNKVPQPPTSAQITAEVDRLYAEGVRYIFPVHLLDNFTGGTAAYEDLFNFSTFRETGNYWTLTCPTQPPADLSEAINYHFEMGDPLMVTLFNAAKFKINTTFTNVPAYPACSLLLNAGGPTLPVGFFPGQPDTPFDMVNFLVMNAELGLGSGDGATAMLQLKDGTSLGPFTLKAPGAAAWGAFSAFGDGLEQDPTQNPPPPSLSFRLNTLIAASDVAQVSVTFMPGRPENTWSVAEVNVTLSSSKDGSKTRLARAALGQVNVAGLMPPPGGAAAVQSIAIREMMRKGMLIDIDHMSDASKTMSLAIAEGVTGGYPMNSGHSGLRGFFAKRVSRAPNDVNERSTSASQYQRIGKLHGMAGIGSGNQDAHEWAEMYLAVIHAMGPNGVGGFGTDTDGFAPGMPPRCSPPTTLTSPTCVNPQVVDDPPQHPEYPVHVMVGNDDVSFAKSGLGTKTWDYRTDGVAHYGMLADFLADVNTYPGDGHSTGVTVLNNLMQGAEYFYQTWKLCETRKNNVP